MRTNIADLKLRIWEILLKRIVFGNLFLNFASKTFFERKMFNSVVGVVFFFLKLKWRAEIKSAQLVSCIIHVLAVTAVRTPEVLVWNPAIEHIFYVFLDTPYQVPIFNNKIEGFFHKNSGFFDDSVFLKNYPLFRPTWNKWFFPSFFILLIKTFFFPENSVKKV